MASAPDANPGPVNPNVGPTGSEPTVYIGAAGVPNLQGPEEAADPTLVGGPGIIPGLAYGKPDSESKPTDPVIVSSSKSSVNKIVLLVRILVLTPVIAYGVFLFKAYGKISKACDPLSFSCVFNDKYALQAINVLQACVMILLVVSLSLSGLNAYRHEKGKGKMRGTGWVVAVFYAIACGFASYAMYMMS